MLSRTLQTSKALSFSLVLLTFFLVNPSILSEIQLGLVDGSKFYSFSPDGPTIRVPLGNSSALLTPSPGPVDLSLILQAEVNDSDGVDTVIGSWTHVDDWEDADLEWNNVTMSHTPLENHPDRYSALALNYTLGPGNWGAIWYYMFFANDTLGHWSNSSIWYLSIMGGYLNPYEPIIGVIMLFAIPVIVIGVYKILIRRSKDEIVWRGKSKESFT